MFEMYRATQTVVVSTGQTEPNTDPYGNEKSWTIDQTTFYNNLGEKVYEWIGSSAPN